MPILSSFIPALLWILFEKTNNLYAENIAILHPYWNAEKANIIWQYMKLHFMNTIYYGWTFTFLLISLMLNCWYLIKKRDNLPILTMILISSVLYMIALYQIDYKWDSIQNVLAHSAKRFLFCFVPITWFYSMSNNWVKQVLKKLE